MTVHEKKNRSLYRDQLIKEKVGLERLRTLLDNTGNRLLRIPQVYFADKDTISMQAIKQTHAGEQQMAQLGRGLAMLHSHPLKRYGLDHDNYIGLNPQYNNWSDNWGAFYVSYRLEAQIQRVKNASVAEQFQNQLDKQKAHLIDFLNRHCHQPTMLHGDLWSGNVLFDEQDVWLIDPAIYQGDNEVDIAMTELFGGFSEAFYRSYHAILPRSEHYTVKRDIYNLYHYLNHYNLFGASYLSDCERCFQSIDGLSL